MNFALTDEQQFLVEAAQQALAGHDTLQAARAGLDDGVAAPLWETAVAAGWPGLLVAEQHDGAGLGALEAMLVAEACGGRLAQAGILGHLPATAVLSSAGGDDPSLTSGERRACLVIDPEDGTAMDVLDAPGADALVVLQDHTVRVIDAVEVAIERTVSYDASLSLATVRFGTPGESIAEISADDRSAIVALQRAMLAAEALGAAEAALRLSTAYATERMAFGRAIGSFQAIKHKLVEMLRLVETARALGYYAGWAWEQRPEEFALAAAAFRVAAGDALDYAAPESIFIHGGIGSTWEHDAPLFYRRAQVLRRLHGGAGAAARTVTDELLAGAREGVGAAPVGI